MFGKMLSLAIITMFILIATYGCATTRPAQNTARQDQEAHSPSIEGVHYATIVFEEGRASLKNLNRKNLHDLVEKAQKQKLPIKEIRILAWADTEYPDKVASDTTREDIKLASKRAENIKKFLKKNLEDADDIDSFNMARRPDLLSKVLRNDEYQVKEAFESSGATSTELPDGSISYTKASKAIVIIDYEGP